MNRTIDLLNNMKSNYSSQIVHFERIIQQETGKPLEIYIENDQIKLAHKITGRDMGSYIPSHNFTRLADAFIEHRKPTLRHSQLVAIRTVFAEFGVRVEV
jgi:hypothetical protein